jgi:trimeric autotransporter adhesin
MKRTILLLAVAGLMMIASSGRAWALSEADTDTWLGLDAAHSLAAGERYDTFIGSNAGYFNTTGDFNSFLGSYAGYSNTTGFRNSFIGSNAGVFNTTGYFNSFLGSEAGYSNTTGYFNSFIGVAAGNSNTTGAYNSFIGSLAGFSNTTGQSNSFLGDSAGYNSTTGVLNTFIGVAAGYSNTIGGGNVFLGSNAGYSETGSNRLYIDNCYSGGSCTEPFIYGEFDTRKLHLDGSLGIGILPSYGVDVSAGGISKSQLHFSLDGTDTGGWITAVGENNFWLSSGAVWDQVADGWVQKSSDEKAVMVGSGAAGYRVNTRSGCPVGTVCAPTTRMTIDYNGNVGFGRAPSHPLHMASGAHVTAGGVWTNVSSREYKDDIAELGAEAAVKILAGLNPVTFKYKAGEDERHVGFIAEDVPELVATKDRKGMSPMDVVAVLTKVVKEQQQIMKEQQGAIKGQQQVNQELMKKLSLFEAQQEAHQELRQELTALKTEMKQLRESGTAGRLARIAQ